MALLVRVDGSQEEVVLPKENVLQTLYALLDCDMVEAIPICEGGDAEGVYETAWADEESRLTGKPTNVAATEMAGRSEFDNAYQILGDCVFTKPGEIE